MSFKKSFAGVVAASLCFTSLGVSAAEWRIKDYDTSQGITPSAPIVYQEFDDNGFPTGRVVSGTSAQYEGLKGFAEIEFKNSWVSDVYPNAEYGNLYADGKYTGRVYATGRDGKDLVTYRDVDFMWEAAAPYKIYSIKQAKLTMGGITQWFGTVEKNYPVQYTGRNAAVTSERIRYGFGDYEVTGTNKVSLVPSKIKANYMDKRAYTEISGITANALAVKTSAPTPVRVDYYAEILIPRTYDLKLTGPSFDKDGNQIANSKVLYGTKESDSAKFNVANLLSVEQDLINGGLSYAEITWTPAGFEKASPYRLYEYLTVDGVIMDGSSIGEGYYKPCIFRYTGATANLKHRTVFDTVSSNGEVLTKIQVSFNEGKTYEDERTGIPTGIYPNVTYTVQKGTAVDGYKTVTPVFSFEFNGATYQAYEDNGKYVFEKWGTNSVSSFGNPDPIEPYVAQ